MREKRVMTMNNHNLPTNLPFKHHVTDTRHLRVLRLPGLLMIFQELGWAAWDQLEEMGLV
jgi:hypothetical protein